MESKLINNLNLFFNNKLPKKYLSFFQELLLSANIYTDVGNFFAIITIFISLSEFIIFISIFLFSLNLLYIFLPFLLIPIIFIYILIKQEKRATEIENSAPDFLRQLSSILKVGLSFENAMEEISKYGEGPLYNEIQRAILEIQIGKNFDEAWIDMINRLKSKELEKTFLIILNARKSGSGFAKIIEDISNDLRDILALKRERKSSVMMAVMFLLISAIVASPFSLGMVSVYGSFMESFGKTSELITSCVFAGETYLIIHSFLIGIIIGIIMYGDYRKGLKFSIPLVLISYIIFHIVSVFAKNFLVF